VCHAYRRRKCRKSSGLGSRRGAAQGSLEAGSPL